MQQNNKRRLLDSGQVKYFKACDSLQSHETKLYKLAGIAGGSSHSGRRTFAGKFLPRLATLTRLHCCWATQALM